MVFKYVLHMGDKLYQDYQKLVLTCRYCLQVIVFFSKCGLILEFVASRSPIILYNSFGIIVIQ